MKILVAEDDPTIQQMIKAILSRKNIDCTIAEDGRKAVEAWANESFDVVFMDVQMPEMDGIEATRAIRQKENARGGHTVIVAMTAYGMNSDEDKCIAAGMDDYLAKPIDLKQMFALIERYSPGVRP